MSRPRSVDPDRVHTVLRLPRDLHARLSEAANERGVAINWLVVRLLNESMDRLIPVDELVLTCAVLDKGEPEPERCPKCRSDDPSVCRYQASYVPTVPHPHGGLAEGCCPDPWHSGERHDRSENGSVRPSAGRSDTGNGTSAPPGAQTVSFDVPGYAAILDDGEG